MSKVPNSGRGRINVLNMTSQGYISKCPFGIYFCTKPNDKKGHKMTAKEKYDAYVADKREICQLASMARSSGAVYSKRSGLDLYITTLKCLNFAMEELSYYNADDIITPLGVVGDIDETIERQEIKNRFSAIRQKIGVKVK